MGRRRGLDLDGRRVAPGFDGRLADHARHPLDEVDVGELEDDPVRDAPRHAQHQGTVAGDPDRQLPAARPGELELGVEVRRRAPLDEVADDAHGPVQRARRDRRAAQDPLGAVAAPDAEVHASARDLVEGGEDAGRHGDVPGRRIRHAGPQAHRRRVDGHQRQQRVDVLPEDVRVEEPAVAESGRLRLARESDRPLDGVLGLERESEVHGRAAYTLSAWRGRPCRRRCGGRAGGRSRPVETTSRATKGRMRPSEHHEGQELDRQPREQGQGQRPRPAALSHERGGQHEQRRRSGPRAGERGATTAVVVTMKPTSRSRRRLSRMAAMATV